MKEYELVFFENFNNLNCWNYEHGFVRNKELQYYTNNNIVLENGIKIIAQKEKVKNENYIPNNDDWRKGREYANYTSSSINTFEHFSFQYGIMEVKAKIPTSKSAWPAIWLLGDDEGWPHGDEIDIMEFYLIKNVPSILCNFMYYNIDHEDWNSKVIDLDYFLKKDANWTDKFHIWKLDWTDKYMKVYIDDELINSIEIDKIPGNKFKRKYYILLNLAIGRNEITPDDDEFPMEYNIEYVKVWQKK